MAADDKLYMEEYKPLIISVGRNLGMDPAVIAGIISRESRAGRGLDRNGFGDNGNGYGLMQIDNCHPHHDGGPYSKEHLKQCTKLLIDIYNDEIKRKFPSWTKEKLLKGALAAYNMGASRVQSYERVDENTTGKDYSNDVVARAQYYKDNGY
ncbi:lysozyme G-like [Aplochiton taeniatus]